MQTSTAWYTKRLSEVFYSEYYYYKVLFVTNHVLNEDDGFLGYSSL
jgi:hypothetical protein